MTHACIVVHRMASHNHLIDWYYFLSSFVKLMVKLSTCIQLRMIKHPSRKVMNFRHLLSCDTIGLSLLPFQKSLTQLTFNATHENLRKVNKGQITTIMFNTLIGLSTRLECRILTRWSSIALRKHRRWRLLLTQQFLTFQWVWCVKIKDTDEVLPIKDDPQFPWW